MTPKPDRLDLSPQSRRFPSLQRLFTEALGPSVSWQVPLKTRTTFQIGGEAAVFIEPESIHQAVQAVRLLRETGIASRVLGGGSNLLIDSAGVHGAVLSLKRLNTLQRHGRHGITAGAGVALGTLVGHAAQWGLAGIEGLAGVPGKVGGALMMNAGTAICAIGPVVESLTLIDAGGRLQTIRGSNVQWAYRSSNLEGQILLGVTLALEPADPEVVGTRFREYLKRKKGSQPYAHPSAGCIFKNPPGDAAGRLVDACGCKGWREGGAIVSDAHANFIVNPGKDATSADVLRLIQRVRGRVADETGIDLQTEVRYWSPAAEYPHLLDAEEAQAA